MKIIELKEENPYFDAQEEGVKNFEIRKNDKNYQVGDILILRRYGQNPNYDTDYVHYWYSEKNADESISYFYAENALDADTIIVRVIYMTDYEQKKGYVVLGTERIQ